jgi:hypothetical protein
MSGFKIAAFVCAVLVCILAAFGLLQSMIFLVFLPEPLKSLSGWSAVMFWAPFVTGWLHHVLSLAVAVFCIVLVSDGHENKVPEGPALQ